MKFSKDEKNLISTWLSLFFSKVITPTAMAGIWPLPGDLVLTLAVIGLLGTFAPVSIGLVKNDT